LNTHAFRAVNEVPSQFPQATPGAADQNVRQSKMSDEFQRVHTMTDYYDGPRGGIADFAGKPHLYASVFDDAEDVWMKTFLLMPIEEEAFALALEDWRIWRRWETAFHAGKASQDTHPALPEDRTRHEELKRLLGSRLKINPTLATKALGEFRRSSHDSEGYVLEVRWTLDSK
jgi:hypothetical protein